MTGLAVLPQEVAEDAGERSGRQSNDDRERKKYDNEDQGTGHGNHFTGL